MSRKLLVIGYVWPEPKTTAAGQRMLQLLQAFLDFEYQITFASTALKTLHSFDLDDLGIQTVGIKLNHASFDTFVKALNPDTVIFDRFMVEEQFGWRVAEQVPKAFRILNTEDLHSLRKTREVCHKKREEFTLEKWKANDITKREVASIYRSDLSLLVSTYEMELLMGQLKLPEQILMHLPFMLPESTEKTIASWPSFDERAGFITYGSGKHEPNVDAIIHLKQTIWPLIRKELPQATLKVFGSYFPKQVLEMHKPEEGFHIMGWVDDLDKEIQKSRVCLAPLRFGAGIKGKLVQAMKNGTPSVTTVIGAEGMMHQDADWPGSIISAPEAFASAAVQLHQNYEAWRAASERGKELIQQYFSKRRWSKQLNSRLEELSTNLDPHRSENFMGSLLQYHTLASTKYMGKWIAEKNSN
ncbi:glycosyltransferase [Muricauda sp. JGD-17]|uniref:Glycosyltransferase n=1 Tax=Flagellimonas ochracea TaxID=2696472 RepID=A0A964T9Z5_9FLAO|nr:glycosyltransferase [Allomuricauda ochracea]NAY90975.1 glycosyltransferase [Allomuricauda ochracea]